ncbi:alpha/beta-hydrolase [Durotheca rogersii]|uniref:alpha/beta-hydrolase n=1 Tax=Durotheca rogersii TaxID=419775 RepID=UPI00221E79CB|nr:alpha/beta-hydrolase [Durotheca rogersii]KAI5855117.1 alpha/beta-hydrolase [Durotheca rogersii]
MTSPVELFTLPDGRTISYAQYGDHASSRTIFYHHGYPSSHGEALAFHDAALRHGHRIISVDRPGMGSSTYQPQRRLLDWPADLLAIADHLKVDRFAVLGVSGGGPYVLACWHQISRSRCVGAGIMGGLFPTDLGLSGMLVGSRMLFWAARWSPRLAGKILDFGLGSTTRSTENLETLEKTLGETVKSRPKPDVEAWESSSSNFRQALTSGLKGAFQNGPEGSGWEARLYGSDWGFKLEELAIEPGKMVIWHGDEDVNVPVAMAEKAAKLLRNAELRISNGHAHMSIFVSKADEAIEALGQMIDTA